MPDVATATARRRLKIALTYALMPMVIVAITVASILPDGLWQELWLGLTTAILVLLVSTVALPPDADDDYAALRGWLSAHRTVAVTVAALATIAALFVFERVRRFVPGESWAGTAVQLSLALWPFSLLLYRARRFVSRAWRGISWLLAILNALAVFVMPFLVFQLIDGTVSLWVALLLLVLAPVVLFVALGVVKAHDIERVVAVLSPRAGATRSAHEDEQARERPRGGLAVASSFCAIASAFLLLGSAIRVPIERHLLEASQVAERGARLPPLELDNASAPTTADRLKLIERYSPVLRLHESESWSASSAAIALAALPQAPAEDCAERARRPCAEAPIEDVLERLRPDAEPPRGTRVFVGGVVYPRLLSVSAELRGVEADDLPPVARSAKWLAQYWLFYPYNNWKADSAIGTLAQTHGGDWEWVAVGLDQAGAPLFVAYSAHCGGSWRPWTDAASVAVTAAGRVLVGGTPEVPASHPLVIVAKGSHANYATPGAREPDWGSCQLQSRVAKAVRWLTFAAAAREETPDLGTFQVPKALGEADTDVDAARPLWWGAGGETVVGRVRLGSDEHGPDSPLYHGAWKRPIHEIFAGDWECDAGAACNAGRG
jgi:hypothetical protein